jgi:hypothetical protein
MDPWRWPGLAVDADRIRCARRSGRRTTWRSTWSGSVGVERARAPAGVVVRAVPGRTARWSAWPGSCRSKRSARPGYAEGAAVRRQATSPTTSPLRSRCATGENKLSVRAASSARLAAGAVARAAAARRLSCGSPAASTPGLAVILDPGLSPSDDPRPQVLTEDRHVRRLSLEAFPGPVESLERLRIPRNFNSRNPQARRDLAPACGRSDSSRVGRGKAARAAGLRTTRCWSSCASSCGATPATSARSVRSTPAGRSAPSGCAGRPRACAAGCAARPTPSPGRSTGSAGC